MAKSRYIAKVGITWDDAPNGPRRYEPGDDVSDLPAASLTWLLKQKLVQGG